MTSLVRSLTALSLLSLGFAVGCGDNEATGGSGGGTGGDGSGGAPVGNVTFHKDIEPILQRSCLHCHTEGRIGGFSLLTYEEAKPQAGVMAANVEAGIMPPWHAIETDQCDPELPFRNDARLSADEIALMRAWADDGAPEGDPADAPPPYQLNEPGLTNASLEMTPVDASVVSGDTDQFTCVVYDPQLTEEKFIDGIHFMPGNPKVAHHALAFRLPRTDAQALSGGKERFDCFGAPPGSLIEAWAPGSIPLELPQGVGMRITPDDVIVVQMHYHPTGTTTEEDRSTVQLRYLDATPSWEFLLVLVGNAASAPELLPDPDDRGTPEFRIPANATDHVEQMAFNVQIDSTFEFPVLLTGTHMHYVGYDARFWVERPTAGPSEPAEECFVETPHWDFNWQRGYVYDADIASLPTVSNGDVLRLECRFNNSMSNRFVAEALAARGLSAPEDVYLGEQTLDEMCLGILGVLVPL
ncbi:MAG: hypothetical protein U0271_25015 [Polyangiaceae bacterium]